MRSGGDLWHHVQDRWRSTPRRWKWLVLALAALVAASVGGLNPYWRPFYFGNHTMPTPTEYEWHCLGRYMLELPKGFQAHTEGIDEWYRMFTLFYGLDVDHKQVEGQVKNADYAPEAFGYAYRNYRHRLAQTVNSDTGKPMLLQETQLAPTAFVLRRMTNDYSYIGQQVELHQLVGTRYVILKAKAYPRYPDMADLRQMYKMIDFEDPEDRLKSISPRLFPLTKATLSRPGFCFGGVVFDAGQDTERSDFDIRWVAQPAQPFLLEVSYQGILDAGTRESFYERIPDLAPETRLKMRVLRDRTTTVGPGLPWHELLTRQHAWQVVPDTRPQPVHVLLGQHAYTQATTLDKPDFELRLIVGEGGPSPSPRPCRTPRRWPCGTASCGPFGSVDGSADHTQ